MTMLKDVRAKLSVADIINLVTDGEFPIQVSAYDGSVTGRVDSPFKLHLASPKAVSYLAQSPGDLGLARAYITGELEVSGVHPGDPYELLKAIGNGLHLRRPPAKDLAAIARSLGLEVLKPLPAPPQEAVPRWRRYADGLLHSKTRDAEAISHHYDVSNEFYEYVLGPSMTYTCACYPTRSATLEEAQENKYRLVFDKLRLKAGDRLLDIGCGWGGMVRYAARRGVHVIGATLSRQQAEWAQKAIAEEGLTNLAEVRHSDYRDIAESEFDAISSIGLTEHIGVANYPSYFQFIHDKLRVGGLLLNHCITRADNLGTTKAGGFIDRYIFPDAELAGSGRIITEAQNVGLEVIHSENLREHYALTLAQWCQNLVDNWDACVAEVGEATAKVWGLYLAGSQFGFERNDVQLHQVLGVKLDTWPESTPNVPLRPWWVA